MCVYVCVRARVRVCVCVYVFVKHDLSLNNPKALIYYLKLTNQPTNQFFTKYGFAFLFLESADVMLDALHFPGTP